MKRFARLGVFVLLAACGTTKVSPVVETDQVREPSPLDPAKPPRVRIRGIDEGALLVGSELRIELDVENYPLGQGWQELVVWVNDSVSFRVHKSPETLVIREGLLPGPNLIRAYLVRSWGESVKFPDAFAKVVFDLQTRSPKQDRSPLMTLVSPRGGVYRGPESKSIPFDFLVWGVQLGPSAHKVVYTLNGEQRVLSAVDAYRFQNLKPGKYDLKLELIDPKGRPVPGRFTTALTSFVVE
jgi:hypothetical protein